MAVDELNRAPAYRARRPAAAAVAPRLAEVPAAVWLAALVTLSVGWRYAAARATVAPSIFPDELIYLDLARSLAHGGGFAVLGVHFSPWTYGPLYPAILAPVVALAHGPEAAYAAAKLLDCVVVSLAAIPAFLLARRLVGSRLALVFAGLTLLVPSLVYSTNLMTESLAYPVFLWAVLAVQRTIERPTARRQAEVLAVLALATLTRAQMVVLVPAFVTAVVAVCVLESHGLSKESLRRYRLTWWTLGCGAVAALAGIAAEPGSLLGLHTGLRPGTDLFAAARWLVYHLAELDLAAGVLPLLAFVLLLLAVRELPPALRVFVATAASIGCWLLVLVALYTTASTNRFVHERYLFYLEPLLVLGLLAWVRQGLPRPRGARLAGVLILLLPLAIPFGDVLTHRRWGVNSATVGLVPWGLTRMAADSLVPVYVGTVALLVVCAIVAVRARPQTAMRPIAAVAVYFLLVGGLVFLANSAVADDAARTAVSRSDPGWIDRIVGSRAEVAALWAGTRGTEGAMPVWESAFFNRSIARIYTVSGVFPERWASTRLALRGTLTTLDGSPVTPRYVLADPTTEVRGTVLGSDRCTGMTLYRVRGPLHVRLVPPAARKRQPPACA